MNVILGWRINHHDSTLFKFPRRHLQTSTNVFITFLTSLLSREKVGTHHSKILVNEMLSELTKIEAFLIRVKKRNCRGEGEEQSDRLKDVFLWFIEAYSFTFFWRFSLLDLTI